MRIVSMILPACLAIAFLLAPTAAAEDRYTAECEPEQPWIGHGPAEPVRKWMHAEDAPPVRMQTCEGEHWDGMDSTDTPDCCPHERSDAILYLVPDERTHVDYSWFGFNILCLKSGVDERSHTAYSQNCLRKKGPNPSECFSCTPSFLGWRYAVDADPTLTNSEAYVAQDVGGARLDGLASQKLAVYAGFCQSIKGFATKGLEKSTECRGAAQGRVGVFYSDWSYQRQIWGVFTKYVSPLAGFRLGHNSHADCDHASYERGWEAGNNECGRDGTAVTLESWMP